MKRLLVVLAVALVALGAIADTWIDPDTGYTWTYQINGDTAEIYNGNQDGEVAAISPSPTGAVTIPSMLGGKPVTSVGSHAFDDCSGLTSVTIGNSVTSIEYRAFDGCSGLTSVTIPDSVTSISSYAFEGCNDSLFDTNSIPGVKLVDGWAVGHTEGLSGSMDLTGVRGIGRSAFDGCRGLTGVTIPDSVTAIGDSAFSRCDGLTSVTIPGSVTSIGEGAFCYCSGLTNVTIPDSVTVIGEAAFKGCSGLTSVTIPDGVTSIGEYAFEGCSALTSAIIGDGVTSIGKYAFYECSGLTSVTIGDSVMSIGACAFRFCGRLISISVTDGNATYSSSNGMLLSKDGKVLILGVNGDVDVEIPDGVTSIGDDAFAYREGLMSVVIPDSVTNIGYDAFLGCEKLAAVTIGRGVMNIGDGAFEYCSSLSSITIPDSVTSVGDFVFCYSGLASVSIGNGVTSIGSGAFQDCSRLGKVTFRGNEPNFEDENPFYSAASYCTVYVPRTATFNVDAGGGWMGMKVEYYDLEDDDPVSPDPVVPDPVKPHPVNPDPVVPGYDAIDEKDIVAPYDAPKAVVLQGAAYDGNGAVVGIVELKLGKVSKGSGKVSGSFVGLDGKKHAIKGPKLAGIDGASPVSVALDVKDLGTMNVTIGGELFAGSLGKYHVQTADVGGNWSKSGAKVYMDAASASLPAGTLEGFLPVGEPVVAAGGKWKLAKAASVKWSKPKKGAALPEIYDEASGKGLVVDVSGGKTNLSGLKLSYTPKKGTFKGSFKIYALEGAGAATKLMKYTVNVTGVVVDGVGHGTATCKKPASSWPIAVR